MTSESPRDLGLQPERTALAWSRTSVSLLLIGLLLLRDGFRHYSVVVLTGSVLVVIVLSGALIAIGIARRNRLAADPRSSSLWLARATTGLLVAAACTAGWSLRF